MSRLRLQVFNLWWYVLSTSPLFILWWSILEILFVPLHRSCYFIGGLSCPPIQTEHSLYIAERTQKAAYNVRCLWIYHTAGLGSKYLQSLPQSKSLISTTTFITGILLPELPDDNCCLLGPRLACLSHQWSKWTRHFEKILCGFKNKI
jgi:hypothetical protein